MDRINGANTVDIGGGRRGFRSQNAGAGLAGTEVTAAWLNAIQENIAKVIEEAGLALDINDWDLLYKALQTYIAVVNGYVSEASARSYLPLYPEILTSDGRMTVTTGAGSIIVAADQGFVHRGVLGHSTNEWDLGERTLPHAANKTYHLRWQHNGVEGSFVLKDLADAGYNPSAASEAHPDFDSDLDDMLIARVVTNGANNPTVTTLVNKNRMKAIAGRDVAVAINGSDINVALNWARQPQVALRSYYTEADPANNEIPYSTTATVNRYGGPCNCIAYSIAPAGSTAINVIYCGFKMEFWA